MVRRFGEYRLFAEIMHAAGCEVKHTSYFTYGKKRGLRRFM